MSKQLEKIKQLIEKREQARLGGGEKAIQKQRKEKDKAEWLEKIGVRKGYEKATLDNYVPGTTTQQEALQAAKDLLNGDITKLLL